MRKTLLSATVFAILTLISGLAMATHMTDLSGNADCEGWEAAATVYWGSPLRVDLDYSVALIDQDGNEIARQEWAGQMLEYGAPIVYPFSGSWDMELCGDYTVVGTFHTAATYEAPRVDESTLSFTAEFTCICEEPGDCFLTPGYWKNHARKWPQDTLMVGGEELSQKPLLKILKASVRGGDATVILGHHLIAAKLNVLNGADDSIMPVIDDADAYLAMHPVFSDPSDEEGRQYALDLKDLLADYNEQGCPEEDDDEEEDAEKSASAVDRTDWGTLKALYR
jgi:hypothetical protein